MQCPLGTLFHLTPTMTLRCRCYYFSILQTEGLTFLKVSFPDYAIKVAKQEFAFDFSNCKWPFY